MTIETAAQVRPLILPFPMDVMLEGFTLLNYPVPPERLRPHVPRDVRLVARKIDGQPMAWLSLFIARNILRGVGAMPAVPLRFTQLNYRTYLETEEGYALYLFRSVVGSDFAAPAFRIFPQLPALSLPFGFDLGWDEDRLSSVEARVGIGGSELEFRAESQQASVPEGFSSFDDAVDFLGNVPHLYFSLPDGRLGWLHSPHPPLRPSAGRLTQARFGWLEELGILSSEEALRPIAFLQGCAPFPTYM